MSTDFWMGVAVGIVFGSILMGVILGAIFTFWTGCD